MDSPFLYVSDDARPERASGWIYNPSAPATEEELTEFFEDLARFFESPKGGRDE